MSDTTGNRPIDGDASSDPAEQDLKATIESIRTDVAQLAALEARKATLDPEDPEVDRLSEEAVRLADRLSRETRAERQLSAEVG